MSILDNNIEKMISVVIINHNYGAFVGKAIESVVSQNHKNFEIIVVDGDSSDNSREEIFKYVNKYPHLITAVFKPTSGQAAAFNLGYKLSKGEVIAFLDADDYFLEEKLSVIAKEHEKYDFICHDRTFHDAFGNYRTTKVFIDDVSMRDRLLKEYGYIYTYNIITSCMSLTKELAGKIFPMPESYITFADCYVKVMAQYYSNIHYMQQALTYYRLHKNQETRCFKEKELELFVKDLYERVFTDINIELGNRGEKLIPALTSKNIREALRKANPQIEITLNSKYVMYGVGVNSLKVKRYIELMGGTFIFACDSNKDKRLDLWEGLEVVSPQILLERRHEFEKVIIGSIYYYEEISNILDELGLECNKDYVSIRSIPND